MNRGNNQACPRRWSNTPYDLGRSCVLGAGHNGKCVDKYGNERPDSTIQVKPESDAPDLAGWHIDRRPRHKDEEPEWNSAYLFGSEPVIGSWMMGHE